MKIDVDKFTKEIIENAREGKQNMKVLEIIEKLDDQRNEFLSIRFINQYGETHYEKFYPDRHARKLYELAMVINDGCFTIEDGKKIVDTKGLIGGYFNCVLTPVPTKSGEVTDKFYIRNIRAFPKRKDTTGSQSFQTVRRGRRVKK